MHSSPDSAPPCASCGVTSHEQLTNKSIAYLEKQNLHEYYILYVSWIIDELVLMNLSL